MVALFPDLSVSRCPGQRLIQRSFGPTLRRSVRARSCVNAFASPGRSAAEWAGFSILWHWGPPRYTTELFLQRCPEESKGDRKDIGLGIRPKGSRGRSGSSTLFVAPGRSRRSETPLVWQRIANRSASAAPARCPPACITTTFVLPHSVSSNRPPRAACSRAPILADIPARSAHTHAEYHLQ